MSSSDLAISVRGLGKSYSIRHNATDAPTTLAESIMRRVKRPFAPSSSQRETFWALKDVSFDVKKGEVVGIIGRNGAGKSTLLKILSRITEPTTGEIDLYGRVGSLLEVGTGFHQELTGRENIYLNGSILGMRRKEIESQFDAIVDFAGVEQFLDTPVKRYSSGMYVRLAFAVAAHLRSDILIVDEVLAVGDAEFQKKCLGKMSEVAKSGRTVLFVSHSVASIRHLCTAALFLERGHLGEAGSVDTCIRAYVDRVVQVTRIIAHKEFESADIRIDKISANGSELDELPLDGSPSRVDIEIRGEARRPLRASLEMQVRDIAGTPLAFFSPGHESDSLPLASIGPFVLRSVLHFPRTNRGEYLVDLRITNPGVETHAAFPSAIRVVSDGAQTATGVTFDSLAGAGWILLEGSAAMSQRFEDERADANAEPTD